MNSELFSGIFEGVKWVWLDLDDTLIDFHANSRAALRVLYDVRELGRFYPTLYEWIDAYERHNKWLWERYSRNEITQDFLRLDRFATPLRDRWTGTKEGLEEFSRMLDPLYLDILASQRGLIDGAVELLGLLRECNYKIGVLSNGFTGVQHKKLRVTGLDKMVDLVVLSDDIGVNKPDVRLFKHAMSRAVEPDPRRHLMIGDNAATDIGGAVNAGWKGVLLDKTFDGPEAVGAGANVLKINSLRRVSEFLRCNIGP